MGYVSKTEVKKHLKRLGIEIIGNYIRKSDVKKAIDGIRFAKIVSNTNEINQYSVYVMSKEEGEQIGNTVPTEFALKRSKPANKKISLLLVNYQDATRTLTDALKKIRLIDSSATEKDIDFDGDENEIGVWYKGIYRFTLIRENNNQTIVPFK